MLSSLYSSDHLRLGYHSVVQLAHETSLSITPDQVKALRLKLEIKPTHGYGLD